MEIDIIKTTMHVYDSETSTILQNSDIQYTVPFIEWIEKLMTTTELKFVLEYKTFFQKKENYENDYTIISERIFSKMIKNLDIQQADMAYVECTINKKPAIVGLKLNYHVNYTHQKNEKTVSFKQLTNAYPKKVNEAFIYYIDSKKLFLCEKSFDEEGKKVYYLSKYALEIEHAVKSDVSKIRTFKSCMLKLNNDIYPDDIDAQIETFNLVQNALLSQKEQSIDHLITTAYQDEQHQQQLRTLLQHKKINGVEKIVTSEKITEIISTKKFRNELGIEVKLASHLLNDEQFVVLKQNEDDSYEITIKKVFLK